MKRAALYCRVSTVDQHPETQLLDLRQFAAQRGLQIVETYTDRRYNIVDMEVLKTATTKIEEHQRKIVEAENSHRTAIVSTKDDADDKTKRLN
jgi:DNA invertase Pin-like site-specific DNA recombinase